jgi:hypothetical protein
MGSNIPKAFVASPNFLFKNSQTSQDLHILKQFSGESGIEMLLIYIRKNLRIQQERKLVERRNCNTRQGGLNNIGKSRRPYIWEQIGSFRL